MTNRFGTGREVKSSATNVKVSARIKRNYVLQTGWVWLVYGRDSEKSVTKWEEREEDEREEVWMQ